MNRDECQSCLRSEEQENFNSRLNLVLTHEFPLSRPLSATAFIHAVSRHRIGPEFIGSRNGVPTAFAAKPTGTGPVVLEVARVTGVALFSYTPFGPICLCAPLFSHTHYILYYTMLYTILTLLYRGHERYRQYRMQYHQVNYCRPIGV